MRMSEECMKGERVFIATSSWSIIMDSHVDKPDQIVLLEGRWRS